jgi:hypothetical protein
LEKKVGKKGWKKRLEKKVGKKGWKKRLAGIEFKARIGNENKEFDLR